MNHYISEHEVVIIGGGPGGATLAALLAIKGVDVAIIEKETFPRFKIGESLLPYSMDILRKSKVYPKIDNGEFMKKFGAQFVNYHDGAHVYFEFAEGLDNDHPFAFQVERAHFDQVLLKHAEEMGAKIYQPLTVTEVNVHETHVDIFTERGVVKAKYLADASGRSAVLGKQKKNRAKNPWFNNIAIFSHFENVPRAEGKRGGDIIVGMLPNHCWSWMIPLKGKLTSLGAVVDAKTYRGRTYDEAFLREVLSCHPLLVDLMKDAKCVRPIQSVSNYSETCTEMIGERWIMVGDAATFLDPVFSTGVHISLSSADFASDILSHCLKDNSSLQDSTLGATYEERLLLGVKRLRSLLLMFYENDFIPLMHKAMKRDNTMQAFTSVVGGDAWNDSNQLFAMKVL